MKYEYEWIVYKTTNILNSHIYIGVHKRRKDYEDGYIGNDIYCDSDAIKKYTFHKAVRKYGYKNFKTEVLFRYNDTIEGKKLAYKKESELVNRDFLKRKDVYNECLGGRIPSSINEREVAQYDMDGNFITTYFSIIKAASETNISKSGIQYACANESYCCNYQWRYFTGNTSNIGKAKSIEKTVYQFDLQGNYITYYKSCMEAAKAVNCKTSSSINAVCLGKRVQSCGYYWSYKKQFNMEINFTERTIPVACYDEKGKFIQSYSSLRSAERETKITRGSIKNCIIGKSKFAGKVRWRYFYGNTSDINSL